MIDAKERLPSASRGCVKDVQIVIAGWTDRERLAGCDLAHVQQVVSVPHDRDLHAVRARFRRERGFSGERAHRGTERLLVIIGGSGGKAGHVGSQATQGHGVRPLQGREVPNGRKASYYSPLRAVGWRVKALGWGARSALDCVERAGAARSNYHPIHVAGLSKRRDGGRRKPLSVARRVLARGVRSARARAVADRVGECRWCDRVRGGRGHRGGRAPTLSGGDEAESAQLLRAEPVGERAGVSPRTHVPQGDPGGAFRRLDAARGATGAWAFCCSATSRNGSDRGAECWLPRPPTTSTSMCAASCIRPLRFRIGFRPEVVSVRECATPERLANLILASSCTPPMTPLQRWNGRYVLDGGVVDNVPICALGEEPGETLILLTRRYPRLPNRRTHLRAALGAGSGERVGLHEPTRVAGCVRSRPARRRSVRASKSPCSSRDRVTRRPVEDGAVVVCTERVPPRSALAAPAAAPIDVERSDAPSRRALTLRTQILLTLGSLVAAILRRLRRAQHRHGAS